MIDVDNVPILRQMKEQKLAREKTHEEWSATIKSHRSDAKADFNNKVVYISAGALLLSVMLFNDAGFATYKSMLIGCWVAFTAALVVSYIAPLIVWRIGGEEIDKLDETKGEDNDYKGSVNRIIQMHTRLNWIVAILTLAGMICLIAYAVANLYNTPATKATAVPHYLEYGSETCNGDITIISNQH